ncbi:Protein disulfide isomerase 2 [Trichoderma guizhouense]|uniref:Protein disulfide-isomerase n=1 Tax=Trichoderma guizhouense TaxID=1491466 RepID=A0A1T3CPU9_9HYPO|nr:Protein disulfide isomerase 2 [Trichoderma guizhouense]
MVMPSLSSVLFNCGLLACAQLACAAQFSGPTEVKKYLAENEHTLLAFVAPNLQTSKNLLKEWKTVQKSVSSAAVIDCLSAPTLCQEMDVVSFPAIRLYQKDGPTTRYRGPRRAAAIEAFVKRALRPSVQDVDGKKLEEFISSDDIVFLLRLQGEDKLLEARFRDFAQEYSDRYSFGITTAKSDQPDGIWCRNSIDQRENNAEDLDDPNALKNFLKICTAELIPQLTRRNEMTHLSSGRSLVYYLSNSEEGRETYTKALKQVASRYAEFLQFVTVDSNEYPDMARNLGVRSSGGLAVQNIHNGQVFPFRGDASSPDSIDQFIVAISEGRAQPWDGTFDEGLEAHDEL